MRRATGNQEATDAPTGTDNTGTYNKYRYRDICGTVLSAVIIAKLKPILNIKPKSIPE
jgi:hypothetical protein